jgi:hypothetical protein
MLKLRHRSRLPERLMAASINASTKQDVVVIRAVAWGDSTGTVILMARP